MGTIVNAAAGWLRIGKKSNAQLIGGNCCMLRIKTRLIFIVGFGESKVTRRKWSTTHTKWNIYVTHPRPDGCLSKTYPYVCLCVCVQCTYLPYITHTLRFVVCARVCVFLFAFSLLRFNPFHAKMLRFDFIFCWGLGWVVAFSYFCCILCCALRGQRQFCPRCALYVCIIHIYYIYLIY